MLILSRKAEQEILIGEDIKLTVVRIEGNRVRIGISAPREVPVLRGELAAGVDEDVSAESQLTPREMAFAHPQENPTHGRRPVGRLCPTVSQPIDQKRDGIADQPGGDKRAELFLGTVTADGGRVQLSPDGAKADKSAPLAGFVAAT